MLTACFSMLLLLIRIAMKLRLSISAGVPGVDAHSVSTVVSCARDTGGWNISGDVGLRDAVMDHLLRSICKARAGLMPALVFCAARWADVAFVWRRPARMRGWPIKPHTSARRAPRRGANGCADVRFRLVP